jgi:hypothetical protein
MKKLLLFVVVPLLVLLFVAGLSLQLFLGTIVKNHVNRHGPELAQTRVSLESVQLSPLTGRGTLTGLLVGNPKGWSDRNVFTLEKIHVEVAPSSIWSGHVIVNELIIEAPKFNYETRLVASNVGDLLKNMEQTSSSDHDPTASTTPKGNPIKIEIRHLLLRNGSVTVGVGPGAATLPLPTVELKDIGTNSGGVTPGQLSAAILKNVTPTLVATAAVAVGKVIPGTAGETVKEAGEILKDLLGGKK